jgi:hypothetical protein
MLALVQCFLPSNNLAIIAIFHHVSIPQIAEYDCNNYQLENAENLKAVWSSNGAKAAQI